MGQLSLRGLFAGERRSPTPPPAKRIGSAKGGLAAAAKLPGAQSSSPAAATAAAAPPPEGSVEPPAKKRHIKWTDNQKSFALKMLDKFQGNDRRARCLAYVGCCCTQPLGGAAGALGAVAGAGVHQALLVHQHTIPVLPIAGICMHFTPPSMRS